MYKCLAYFLIINFFFYICSYFLGLERVFFNIDYFIVLGLLAFKYKKTASILFFCIFFCDLLVLVGQIFPFFRLSDIIYISKFIWLSSFYYQLIFIVVCFLLLILIYFNFRIKLEKNELKICFLFFSLLFVGETIYLQYKEPVRNKQLSEYVFIDSISKQFIALQFKGIAQSYRHDQKNLLSIQATPVRLELESRLMNGEGPKAVLYIIDESLGYPKDKAVLNAMIKPLVDYKDYLSDWDLSKIVYTGPTMQAELRELCQAQAVNFNLEKVEIGFENCLAHSFKKYGYQTTAVHGALGLMYDRKYWYPRAGFENLVFRDSQKWNSRCYSFPGVCDHEVSQKISEIFKQSPKHFLYWLTLNTHTNYDLRDVKTDLFNCPLYGIDQNSEACRNIKLQTQFFDTLVNLIKQPHMNGVEVIIVGDHTPPMFNQNDKKRYFDGDNVLSLKFIVDHKQLAGRIN